MLPAQSYNPGRYPPGPQWAQFGDDLLGHSLSHSEEARAKLARKRQGLLPFHVERLERDGLLPARPHMPAREIDTQTDNFVSHANTQTEMERRMRAGRPQEQSDEEVPQEPNKGGGSGSLTHRATRSAQAAARHFAGAGAVAGAVAGAGVVGGSYVVSALGSLGYHGAAAASSIIGNAMRGGDPMAPDSDDGPEAQPLAVQHTPRNEGGGGAVPAFLLDQEERAQAARKPSHVGAFASREQDRRRLAAGRLQDQRDESRRAAEDVIRRNLG